MQVLSPTTLLGSVRWCIKYHNDIIPLSMTAQVTVRASAVIPARSAVLRGPTERAVLDLLTARLAAVSLSGYIFFGSSVKISDQARTGRRLPADHDN